MKKNGSGFSWVIRLALLGVVAYLAHPFYWPSKPTLPGSRGAGDYVRWTVQDSPIAGVLQEFTIHGDGRNLVRITRPIGDPDLPELNIQWKVRRDKATGFSEFTREGALPADKARGMLDAALSAGALDVTTMAATDGEKLTITTRFDGRSRDATGPLQLALPIDWKPSVWKNRIRWQKLGQLIRDDATLRDLLAKKEVILVDDDGKPVD